MGVGREICQVAAECLCLECGKPARATVSRTEKDEPIAHIKCAARESVGIIVIQSRVHCLQRVQLAAEHSTSGEVGVGVRRKPDLPADVSNVALHRVLRVAQKGPREPDVASSVAESVDAWTDVVQEVRVTINIEDLELDLSLVRKGVCTRELSRLDGMATHDTTAPDKLAVVAVVGVRDPLTQHLWPIAVEVRHPFFSLVATRDPIRDVTRGAIKGTRKERCRTRDLAAVCLPRDIVIEHGPWVRCSVPLLPRDGPTPQAEETVSDVEGDEVHVVEGEASRQFEHARETAENAGFSEARLLAVALVFGLGARRHEDVSVGPVLHRALHGIQGERAGVDVVVRARRHRIRRRRLEQHRIVCSCAVLAPT